MAHATAHDDAHADHGAYYVPHHSPWPFYGSIALFTIMVGGGAGCRPLTPTRAR